MSPPTVPTGFRLRPANVRVFVATLIAWFFSMATVLKKHTGQNTLSQPNVANFFLIPTYTIAYNVYVFAVAYALYNDRHQREDYDSREVCAEYFLDTFEMFQFATDRKTLESLIIAFAAAFAINFVVGIFFAWYTRNTSRKTLCDRMMTYGYVTLAVNFVTLLVIGGRGRDPSFRIENPCTVSEEGAVSIARNTQRFKALQNRLSGKKPSA